MSGKVKETTLLFGLAVLVWAYLPEESQPRVQGNQAAEGVAWAHAVARLWPPPTDASSGHRCGPRCELYLVHQNAASIGASMQAERRGPSSLAMCSTLRWSGLQLRWG